MIPEIIRKFYWFMELVPKLGVRDVFYVAYYRLLLKSGMLKKKFPVKKVKIRDEVFLKNSIKTDFPDEWKGNLLTEADKIINGSLPYYSYHRIRQTVPPNWFLNPFNGKECREIKKHWTEISDFNKDLGDIKNVWESSRFSWAGILSRAYAMSGNDMYLDTLNSWTEDRIERNPVNQGPNWKCGQEASIRVFNLLNAAQILIQTDKPSNDLILIIRLHLERIYSNRRYAFAQRNNHATSEAAALFIGGNWLEQADGSGKKQYLKYAKEGRRAIEHYFKSLVYEDGSFAQHSVNYHRLFIDTLCLVVFWTQKLNLKPFTEVFYNIARKSTDWLLSILDKSGDCPNLGSNDGTLLQVNHSCDYRDFRPSLQTASALIKGCLAFEDGPWDEALYWFDLKKVNFNLVPNFKKTLVHKSGYVIMNSGNSWALLRFPFYRFRPSHNDAFHFDLWANGRNILLDSGSFSYNPDKNCEVPDLKSVHSHNTLSFDSREQMPRLGRFLLGKWLKPLSIGDIIQEKDQFKKWEGSYLDYSGNFHFRRVKWKDNNWEIYDKFRGKAQYIEIGYNFENCRSSFEIETNSLLLPWGRISVSHDAKLNIQQHRVSSYYMQLSLVNRLVITLQNNSEITTSIKIY